MPTAALRPRGSVSSDQTRRASPGSEGILGPPQLVIPGLMSRSYLPSLEKEFALPLIAFNAILGPFHPMNSSFLSSPLCRGIAVIGFGRWHEAPVMGVSQSGEQRFRQNEGLEFRVVRKFGSAPAGVSTTTCTSPSSVKGGRLMKFGMAKSRRGCAAVRRRTDARG